MIRLGIIGTGRIAKRTIRELRFVEEFQVTAVYNPSFEHGQEFARWATEEYYRSRNVQGLIQATLDLYELADQVDAVYIASPHITHYDYAKELLEAGRHVMCEKPMAFNPRQVKELFSIAEKKKCILMEGIKTAYCPGFKKLEEVVASGIIGEVVDVEAAFTRLTQPGCREFDDRKYGGSFTEFGTYNLLPIFRFLGTEYSNVEFMSIPAVTGVDGYTKAVFSYNNGTENGRRVSAMATAKTGLTAKSEGQLLITGTQGYILVPSPWWLTRYFEVRFEDPSKVERYECEFAEEGLRYEYMEFAARVKEILSDKEMDLKRQQFFSREESEACARAGVMEKALK